jgi:serine/threonine-protein kinase
LFAAIMIAAIARLRPEATLFFGAFNGVMFLVVYFVGLEGTLSEAERARPMLSPPMQVVRATAFVAGGALAYSIGRALRRAIGRAERSVRKADLFGKYRLGEKLGAGGMGTVHRAIYCPEGGFERTVAVKLLHGHLADKPEFIRAFREEAELSARLVHPNIVQVLDFGRWGDSYFLAMEHVDGVTLSTVMRLLGSERRAMDPEDVAWLGVNLLAGLEFSHDGARDAHGKRLRVIHRDLCPANVLISSNGDVRISDFGIAKALGDATFSETKTIAGHAGYMAPEQVRAEPLDERCDLFAVGVVLWELCAGRSLFRRGSEGMSALAVLNHEVPPLLGLPDERREGWEAFFRRALAPDKGARFQGAAEMSSALAALRTTTQPRHEAFAALVMEARAERAPSPHEPTTEATKVDG